MNKMQDILRTKRCYIILVVACLILYFFSPHIINFLLKAVSWIEPCPQWCFVTLVIGAALCLSIGLSNKIWNRQQHVSGRTFAAAIFLIIVYTFFRFIDAHFEFWPLKAALKWTDIFYIPFGLLLVLKFIPKKSPDVPSKMLLLSDEPICKPEDDLLGHYTLSEWLLKDLNATNVSKRSYSVGIIGMWGQGKSSFLNFFMIHAENQGSIVVTFNPRSSRSLQTIQEDFFKRFKEELSHYHTGIEHHITNYAKDVAITDEGWIGKAALAINMLSQSEEKTRINSMIKQINRRIFVLIDDFDRLTGEEILEVLKLIEANGDFCNTIYLTAYDKKQVNEVLNKYMDTTPDVHYTDKYFNYEYLLPASTNAVSMTLFRRFISEELVLPENSIIKKEAMLDAWNRTGSTIVSCLPNLRHIKRYYNIFASRFLELTNDVDISDFMLLTLLRYKDIAAYNSLFRLSFLRRGSTLNGSEKMMYLQDGYQNNEIFKSLMLDSQRIIEMLFSVSQNNDTTLLTEVYRKLRWADSFYSYFFDFRIGKYHIEDFLSLFTLPEKDAFDKLTEIYKAKYFTQLEDFFNTRDYNWITNEAELERMIKLIAHLDSLERSLNLQLMLERFTRTFAEEEYIKSGAIRDKDSYKSIVLKSFQESLDTCSLEICFVCQIMLDSINSKQLKANEVIFSVQEFVDLAVWAQRTYYSIYPDGDYNFSAILNLANIREVQGQKLIVVMAAQEEFVSMMKLYPDKFAKDVILVTSPFDNNGKACINLRFNEYFKFQDYLPEKYTLYDWVSDIKDKSTAYVVESVVEKALRNEILTVPALKPEYKQGDFDGFYEAIKTKEDKDDEQAILKAIQNNNTPDLYSLGIASSLPKERVKGAIMRLVNKQLIEEEFLKIKDRINPFEKGDLIKLSETAFTKVEPQLIYSNNVFKIIEISIDGSVKLAYIQQPISISDIEAIKIDGIQDRDIYYDPIIAAPIVPYDAPAPVMPNHQGEYFMDGLENTTYQNKNLKQLVLEADCRYVHEVQHYLRAHFKTDDLKVDEKIKQTDELLSKHKK